MMGVVALDLDKKVEECLNDYGSMKFEHSVLKLNFCGYEGDVYCPFRGKGMEVSGVSGVKFEYPCFYGNVKKGGNV